LLIFDAFFLNFMERMTMNTKVRVSSDFRTLSASAICGICLFWSAAASTDPLKSYNVDPTQISVSGISSGGYMAQQFHVAFSKDIMGAGIIAGGPYYCAENNQDKALTVCSTYGEKMPMPKKYVGPPSPADVDRLVAHTKQQAGKTIDPIASLQTGRVFMFSGSKDMTVPTGIMDALKDYYDKIGVTNVHYVKELPAGHAQIVKKDYPTFDANDCGTSDPPYINECETAFPAPHKEEADLAGRILSYIYENLGSPQKPTREAIEFDQAEFTGGAPNSIGLDEKGYLYVPEACAGGALCKLHVAFHGCHQGKNQAPEGKSSKYVKYAGYNEWAEQNNILVLYPQIFPSPNPPGCWDWWGQAYTDANYANKNGKQMAAVKAMIDRVAKLKPDETPCFTTDNPTHVANNRAYACGLFGLWACAQGSNDDLGLNFFFLTTSLKQTGPGRWAKVARCQ
jgi:poly(3-hydroxybutyrate) depolymerase